jgi:DNA-binding CsgD family transcriptional regulator
VGDLVTDVRVVTLTGSGGCGKTRLAVEVAGDVATRFSDGAHWVDLAGVDEPGMVAPAVGTAMGIHGRSGESPADTLAEQLRARHLLVVLDNGEHLVAGCAGLVGVLASACEQLHVLTTSREPLAVAGEVLFEVPPLRVPDVDARSAGAVAAADAARLFEVRARQAGSCFRINDDNAAAVAEICRRLDGIPLAIELAAARVRVLAPAQIAAGLSDRFGLLTGGLRGAPPRQQTLEASLDWSYELLDRPQRLALARLSVFAASFELDAAEVDWAVESRDPGALPDIAEPLLRFWIEHGLSAEIYQRLHAAVDAPDIGDDDRARGLIAAAVLAVGRGEPASAHASADQAIDASRAAGDGASLALGLSLRAFSGAMSGRANREQAGADTEEAVEQAEECGDAATHVLVLMLAGPALLRSHTIADGCRLLEQAIAVCEANEITFHLPAAHASLGAWPAFAGKLDRTRRHAQRGLELSRQVGRPGWEAVGLAGLGAAELLQGDHGQARRRLSEAQEALRPRGSEGTPFDLLVRHWLALSAYLSGDPTTARTAAETIVRIGRDRHSRWDEAVGEWLLGEVALGEQRPDEARAHLERSHARSSDPRSPFPLGRASLGLAELARVGGDLEEAWELAHDALEVLAAYGDLIGSAAALESLAELAAACGKPEQALRLLGACERFHAETGIERFPRESDRFARALTAARAAVDVTDAIGCWEAGRGMALADAIAYARRGRGARGRPQSGWASLTPAERDLVRLVAQGCTNAEIGERLFMSVNTVKKHLSHVYTKVDVDGRADLAAEVARREL